MLAIIGEFLWCNQVQSVIAMLGGTHSAAELAIDLHTHTVYRVPRGTPRVKHVLAKRGFVLSHMN